MNRTDNVVEKLMQDEDQLRQFLRYTIQNAAYLIAKREWDEEDNYNTTEQIKILMDGHIPEKDIVEIYSEGDYEIDLEDIKEHLRQYHPDADDKERS